MTSQRVLITGASGFLGRGLVPALAGGGYIVRAATRTRRSCPARRRASSSATSDCLRICRRRSLTSMPSFHLAGLPPGPESTDGAVHRDNNLISTERLAESAARAGVRCFVYLSSVRAQTGATSERVVTEELPAAPTDAYGRSKLEAERAVARSGAPAVILRPALVHGPGMRFNMAALLKLALTPYPLPVRSFRERRLIVARTHLTNAVLLALSHSEMAGQTYLVADPEPLSMAEMVGVMRAAIGRRPNLMPIPRMLARAAAHLAGLADAVSRIEGSLVVDPTRLLRAGWKPALSSREALTETVRQIVAKAP